MGANCCITAPFWCDYGYNIELGENFYSNHNLVILDCGKVTFGDNVFVAPDCGFHTAGHPIDYERRNQGLEYAYALLNPTPGLSADCGGHDFAKGRTMKRAYSKSQYAKPLAATAVITGTSATKAPCLRITGTWRRYEFRIFLRFSP